MTLTVGALALDTGSRLLSGPRGAVTPAPQPYALLAALMRWPGRIVEHGSLMSALYPDPDLEPEEGSSALRYAARDARACILAVGAAEVLVQAEPSVGYRIRLRDRP